jgi:hypothetical protein
MFQLELIGDPPLSRHQSPTHVRLCAKRSDRPLLPVVRLGHERRVGEFDGNIAAENAMEI